MFTPKSVTRNQEHRIGKIVQADSSTQTVVMMDRFGGLIQISLHVHDSIATMPAIGEVWMVKRVGIDWVLDKRLEDGSETIAFKDLEPGDRRLYTPNNLTIIGSGINIQSDQPVMFNADTVKFANNVVIPNLSGTNIGIDTMSANSITFPDATVLTSAITYVPTPFDFSPKILRSGVALGWGAMISGGQLLSLDHSPYVPTTAIKTYSWKRTDTNAVLSTSGTYVVQAADNSALYGIYCVVNYYENTSPSLRTNTFNTISVGNGNKQVFTYVGADQTFTYPSYFSAKDITVKLWAAGGGGGGEDAGNVGGNGGAGAFVQAKFAAIPGQTYTIRVGGGGGGGQSNKTTTGKGAAGGYGAYAGGEGGNPAPTSGAGGGGGGLSGVWLYTASSGTILAVAGGGGGGTGGYGGSGGYATYGYGGNHQVSANGTTISGGKGADWIGDGGGGGGGGAGYYGGAGGSGQQDNNGSPNSLANGGKSYTNSSVTIVTNTTGADGSTTGTNNTDVDYISGIAAGGAKAPNNVTAGNGGNGLVVIIY